MHVIHFTEGATDPIKQFRARGARFVPLADGSGDYHVSCLHLATDGRVPKLAMSQDCTLLVVHGDVVVKPTKSACRLDLSAGVGVVLEAGEHVRLESSKGAVLIMVQGRNAEAHSCGISSPQRIAGQRWPSDPAPGDQDRSAAP